MAGEKDNFSRVKEILIERLQVKEKLISPEANLKADLSVNSLELADLALALEEETGVEIPDKALRSFLTVGDVVAYLDGLPQNP